jgi:dihydrofolate reductase
MIEIVLIAAVARNGVIGRANGLPFRLPSDMKHFKALTLGHPVLMGRATHESIGRALPGRPNIVVSGDHDFRAEGCEVYSDLEAALQRGQVLAQGLGKDALFVIGGGQIYAQTIDEADRLELTHVAMEAEGDTQFPPVDPKRWGLVSEQSFSAAPGDEADMVFATYRRTGG